jgi:hypothetical protein
MELGNAITAFSRCTVKTAIFRPNLVFPLDLMHPDGRRITVNYDPQPGYRSLYSAYKEAWTRFSTQVAKCELLSSDSDGKDTLENTLKDLEHLECLYLQHRNALAAFLLSNIARKTHLASLVLDDLNAARDSAGLPAESQLAVQAQAHRFWEEGGRRDGQAASDWSRAQNYVRDFRTSEGRCADTEAAA